MRRRDFVRTSALIGVSTAIAGCSTNSTGTETTTQGDGPEDGEQQTEPDAEDAVRYFFDDQTGALGHLGDDTIPEGSTTITNTATESDYQEMQRNDRAYAEMTASWRTAPNPGGGGGLDMTVDEMIERTEEIYNDPVEHIEPCSCYDDLDLTAEDDEIVFTRALIRAAQEAGTDSSGLADIVTANMAEDAMQQIQPGFTNYKLSTIDATEPIGPDFAGHSGGVRENEWGQEYGNSGFRHLPGLLQYQKDGEAKVKYVELTDATNVDIFRRVIREPEFSLYRSNLNMDTVATSRDSEPGDTGSVFPEHYVTALDYEKARELESQGILGLGNNRSGGINAVGDYLGGTLIELVDDMGITGYDENTDRNLNDARPGATDGKLVSDSFGKSIEEYVTNPDPEKRQYMENVGRALYQLHEQEGWGSTEVAITGTLENPEFIPTDQETINQVRQDEAYDEVRQRVTS